MPQITVATTTVEAEGRFRCQRCGYASDVDVVGVGEGTQSFLNTRGTAARRAARAARANVAWTIGAATCPACHRRNPGAGWRIAAPTVLGVLGFVALGVVLGYLPTWANLRMRPADKATVRWVMPLLVAGPAVLMFAVRGVITWRGIDRRVTFRAPPP